MSKKKEASPAVWLTDDEKTYLNQFDDDTLADWWAYLNGSGGLSCEGSRNWAVMNWIYNKLGQYKCLYAWNIGTGLSTKKQFEVYCEKFGITPIK